MCGISGIFGEKYSSYENIKSMNISLVHRGPDDSGFYSSDDNNLHLAMTRLAIIDIEYGKQPLKINDDNYIIVFNGEIFNSYELRTELEKKGEVFFSKNSDTEVILRLYSRYGVDFLEKLNGMFAFAIYDKKNKKLFIARDRFGIKPLYFYHINNNLIFSSEIKAILNVIDKPSIDAQSFYHYSSLKYVPLDKTIYENIDKLLPGHYLVYDLNHNNLEIKKWWDLEFNIKNELRKNDWYELVKDKLLNSVKRWTISDVNCAFTMSGGLDSTALVACNSMISENFNCYTFGFKEEIYNQWNETHLAKDMDKKFNINIINIFNNRNELINNFHKIISALEEPYGGGLPSYLLFREISKNEKVVITGVGGDELFGNYQRAFEIVNNVNENNTNHYKLLEQYYHDKIYKFSNNQKIKYLTNTKNLNKTNDLFYEIYNSDKKLDTYNKIAKLEILTQLPDEYLNMTDKFSMIHSLEARTPFLDHELMELAFSIPTLDRFDKNNYKNILRNSMKTILPDSIRLNNNKKGFSLPISLLMRSEMRNLIEHYIGKKNLLRAGFINPKFYSDYVEPFLLGDNRMIETVWGLFIFHYWLDEIY